MKIRVLFFARCRDITGCREAEMSVSQGTTVEGLRCALLTRYPELEGLSRALSVAVNREYAPDSTVLRSGDDVALIPPVSGG